MWWEKRRGFVQILNRNPSTFPAVAAEALLEAAPLQRHAHDPSLWSRIAPLVDCRILHWLVYIIIIFFIPSTISRNISYDCIDIHCAAAGSTAGKLGSPVAFSSRWKHFSTAAAVALETWSLSLFNPQSSLLASLSVLLPAIRVKPAAGLAVLKCSLQLNTFK